VSATSGARAGELRRRLADRLEAKGDLRSPQWRRAVERVPREAFLGGRVYRQVDGHGPTLWEPMTPADVGEAEWLELAYENTSWVTQLDGQDQAAGQSAAGAVQGAPTSSSTLPGLVVRMLEDLGVGDGQKVLEIGTGSGYSTALLCQRLGDDRVASIEVDPGVAARARLAAAGHAPTLICGDGLTGHAAGGPYDRIIATCSVRAVPAAWLAQTRPGGRVLTTLSGWLSGSGLVALQVAGNGCARGCFLPGTVSFMPARAHAAPPLTDFPACEGEARPARFGPEILVDWMGRFLAQLAAPNAQNVQIYDADGEPPAELLVDQSGGSYAWLVAGPGGGWRAVQGGPARLWDQIEQTIASWHDAGEPAQHAFAVTITPAGQTVRLHTPDGLLTWPLPTLPPG
jgi:methyltransferase of ATP-grasp peptide maturase system